MKLTIDNKAKLSGASPKLHRELVNHFTIENPAFVEAVKAGRCAFGLDRMLCFCQETREGLVMPRGAARDVLAMAQKHGPVEIIDHRLQLPEINLQFLGNLCAYQQQAIHGLLGPHFGVLDAGTGSGKTVMGLAMIAARQQPALILVHTKELLYQWKERIQTYLGIEAGLIGDGHFDVRPVSVGIINTAKKATERLSDRFGHLVVDECHRTPSGTFSETVTAFPAKYSLGLSATPYRRDGLGVLIGWYLGQHRQRVEMSILHEVGAVLRPKIITRETGFWYPYNDDYTSMISALAGNQARNSMIAADIQEQSGKGGLSLVVSDRTAHLETLADMAGGAGEILTGKTPTKKRKQIVEQLAGGEVSILFSTLSLIGEGFDCPAMDSLFLASPIKFSGRLKQVVGRVLRPAKGKQPLVYDYADNRVGLLHHQWKARQRVFAEM